MSSFLAVLTPVHVVLSLIGILTGLVVVFGLLTSELLGGWTKIFLWTTLLTSLTGFLFPIHKLTPGLVFGILSLIALAFAWIGRYRRHLAGHWRATYAVTAIIALYLNTFILIVQLYEKVPALRALAPTQSEPPFKFTQLVALIVFFILAVLAPVKFHPAHT